MRTDRQTLHTNLDERYTPTTTVGVSKQETITVLKRNKKIPIKLKPGFHSNSIACVACVAQERKRLRWQAANHG